MSNSGAISFAEGRVDFRTDVSVVLNNGVRERDYVVRTCLQSLADWRSRYHNVGTPFRDRIAGTTKDAFTIGNEIWIFDIDATKADDICVAVQIGMGHYKVRAEDIIGNVYVKNLNVENEIDMVSEALIAANKELYMKVCRAIIEAARRLGCENTINFWVFSNSKNPKIPREHLHEALEEGGATEIETDEQTRHIVPVGSNDGTLSIPRYLAHIHVARLRG